MAASAAPTGGGGTYTATSLAPSGAWAGGGNTGAFTYSYPISVPPSVGGDAPGIALSYDSASVDGRNSATNSQASWIGDGWDYSPGYVERSYKACSDDGQPSTVGDECWAGDNATLSVAGHSGVLVPTGTNNQWRLSDDDGSIVDEISVSSTSAYYNGMNAGTYWRLTTNDGTQYFFGVDHLPSSVGGDGTDTSTNAAWGVPVFGDDTGEPCHASTFDTSRCTQGWRWNLDFVLDTHTNITAYRYTTESNYYMAGTSHTRVSYTRGGVLASVSYGQLAADYVAKATPAAQVTFAVVERCDGSGGFSCTSTMTSANASHWPDVPFDQICGSTGTCTNYSPTFFTRKALASITTKVWDTSLATPAWSTIDTYTLAAPSFPDPGDPGQQGGTAEPALWLASISHVGSDTRGGGTATAALTTSFTGISLANRVNGISLSNIPPINRFRMSSITTETGSQIVVTYDTSAPCNRTSPPVEDNDTTRCFPVRWTPQGYTDPVLDWFTIYPVIKVSVADSSSTGANGSPNEVTAYSYIDPAWHRDDSALTADQVRTWGQFRGFRVVTTTSGASPDPISKSVDYYLQGMSGDAKKDGTSPATPDVIDDDGNHITDANPLANFEYQSETYLNNGGPLQAATVSRPWESAATATQTLAGLPDLVARFVRTDRVDTRQLTANGQWRVARTTTSYGATTGLPTDVDNQGQIDTGNGIDGTTPDECTHTDYATNTAKNMFDFPWQVITTPGSCATAVSAGTLSASRTYYDGAASGVVGAKGDISSTTSLHIASSSTWTVPTTATYDAYGRVAESVDAIGRRTDTAYGTTTASAPTTLVASKYLPTYSTTTTYPLGTDTPAHLATTWQSSTTLDPGRQTPIASTDVNGDLTSQTYDGLGRLTQVWAPNHLKASFASSPSMKFAYAVSATAYSTVSASTLRDDNNYSVDVKIYDAMLHVRQEQSTPSTGERGTRMISDTEYDSHGWTTYTDQPYYNTASAPTTTLVAPATTVPGSITNAYDGRGRILSSAFKSNAVLQWSTSTTYPGEDQIIVTPPAGGIPTTTVTNARGEQTQLWQSTGGGQYDVTYYGYDSAGRSNKIVGPIAFSSAPPGSPPASPLTWTTSYDALGDATTATDPDTGTTTSKYNDVGMILSTTDSSTPAVTIGYHYDALGRKDYTYNGTNTASKIASWTYDPAGGKGLLASSTRYNAAGTTATYTETVAGYTAMGDPTGGAITVPAHTYGNAAAITYTTVNTYTPNLDLPYTQKITDSAAGSWFGSATETYGLSYDIGGLPVANGGIGSYETNTYYDPHGRVTRAITGVQPKQTAITNSWDEPTGRLVTRTDDKEDGSAAVDNTTYTYTASGLVTSATNREDGGATAATVDRQCFGHDLLDRLTDAWTSSTGTTPADPTSNDVGAVGTCASTNPSTVTHTGPAPYWQSYSYDTTGNRTSITNRTIATNGTVSSTAVSTDTPYSSAFTAAPNGGPHALDTEQTGANTTTYTYDAGKTLADTTANSSGVIDTSKSQSFAWNVTGQLSELTVGPTTSPISDTKYTYSADGALVAHTSSSGTTLYLGGDTISLSSSGTPTQAERTYTFPGGPTTVRLATSTTNKVHFQTTDPQGTGTTDIDASTLAVTRRAFTPFGASRSATTGPGWTGDRGFVNGTQDPTTSLTNLGAREYNPALGRFLSVDPILNRADAQSMNGYSYAENDPVSNADPTGLLAVTSCPNGSPAPDGDRSNCPSANSSGSGGGSGDGSTAGSGAGSGGNGSNYAQQGGRRCNQGTIHDMVCREAAPIVQAQAAALNLPISDSEIYYDLRIPFASKNNPGLNDGYADLVIVFFYHDPQGNRIGQAFVWEVKAINQDKASRRGGNASNQANDYALRLSASDGIKTDDGSVVPVTAQPGWRIMGPYEASDDKTIFWGADPGAIVYGQGNNSKVRQTLTERTTDPEYESQSMGGPLAVDTLSATDTEASTEFVTQINPEYVTCVPN